MSKKYLCPKHKEATPSANAYSDGYHCFGCGARGPLSELGIPAGERIETVYVEDIKASVDLIKRLPKEEIRGFNLHADRTGYYLLFPGDVYYKRRIYGAVAGNKYRGPSGHRKPWFKIPGPNAGRLLLVEGEFNALSLAAIEPAASIYSPGGAGDFYSKGAQKDLEEAARFQEVHIIVDADAAGAQAAIETKVRLVALGCPDVRIHLVEKDFNQIHVEQGRDALRETARKMGLL